MLFKYKTLTKEGEEREGSIEALNKDVAITSLQGRGLTIISVESSEKTTFLKKRIAFFDSIPTRDIVILSRQLSTLFQAHVSALRVFRLLAAETENELLQEKLGKIADDIQGGSSISQALSRHPKAFSSFYVGMVKIGEESGKLNEIFLKLADYLERSYGLTLKIRNALIYPIFVIVTFVLVMILMLTLVFPRLAEILSETGQAIPLYTKIVIGISDFLVNYGLFFLVLLILGGVWLWRFIQKEGGKKQIARLKIQLPFFGTLYKKLYLSRISENMNVMLTSGVSVIRTLEITSIAVDNAVYENILTNAIEDVKSGQSISQSFSGYKEMPGILVQMIKIGEETGELGSILGTLSTFYRREVNNSVDILVGLIEPALIILLAVGVGLILASVLIPIYNLATAF